MFDLHLRPDRIITLGNFPLSTYLDALRLVRFRSFVTSAVAPLSRGTVSHVTPLAGRSYREFLLCPLPDLLPVDWRGSTLTL